MEPTDFVILPLIGLLAGVLGGLLGIGGGLVMIPAMLLALGNRYGEGSMHVYKLAALLAAVVLSLRAVWRHSRAGAVVFAMIPGIVGLGVVGVVAGVGLGTLFAADLTHVLRRIFGGFMIASVLANQVRGWLARRAQTGPTACPTPQRWLRIGTWVGLPSGVISGLLGVGGGVWAVPIQHYVLGVRMPCAIANSACMIVGLAGVAAVAQSTAIGLAMPELEVWDGWLLAALLAPGALLGAGTGAALTHRLPVGALRAGFDVLLVVTGLRLLLG